MSSDSKDAGMASLTSELHGMVSQVTSESRQELQQVRDLVAQSIALLDSSFTAIAEGTDRQRRLVGDLLDQLSGGDANLTDTASRLELNNGEIHEQLAAAIRSLQFEDMVRQVMEHLDERLAALDEATARLASQAEDLGAAAPGDCARQVDVLCRQLGSAREQLRLTDHRAVTQSSLAEGDIELF